MHERGGALCLLGHIEKFTLSRTANSSMSEQIINQMDISVNFDGRIRVLIT